MDKEGNVRCPIARSSEIRSATPLHLMTRRVVTVCGVLSSLLYVGTDVLGALRWEGYSYPAQAVSELRAIGWPLRPVVAPLLITYSLLVIAYGVGVWRPNGRKRALRLTDALLDAIEVVGLAVTLFFPMRLRGVEETLADTRHAIPTGDVAPDETARA
jgi:hypothetical protein